MVKGEVYGKELKMCEYLGEMQYGKCPKILNTKVSDKMT